MTTIPMITGSQILEDATGVDKIPPWWEYVGNEMVEFCHGIFPPLIMKLNLPLGIKLNFHFLPPPKKEKEKEKKK